MNPSFLEGMTNNRTLTDLCLSSWKLHSQVSIHINLIHFLVNQVKGIAMLENFWQISNSSLPIQGNYRSPVLPIPELPLLEITWLRNLIEVNQKAHLLNFAYKCFFHNVSRTILRCYSCSFVDWKYIKRSSIIIKESKSPKISGSSDPWDYRSINKPKWHYQKLTIFMLNFFWIFL